MYSHLNDEENELFRTAKDLCGYNSSGMFVRDVLCGFSMRAISKYTTPKVVDEVMSEVKNQLSHP